MLGVTGGIAAYKAADLASNLVQLGTDVHVLMTHVGDRLRRPDHLCGAYPESGPRYGH